MIGGKQLERVKGVQKVWMAYCFVWAVECFGFLG